MTQMANPQEGGATPMGCGIRLAADQLRNIGNFNANKRQIITLVTDGVANCQLDNRNIQEHTKDMMVGLKVMTSTILVIIQLNQPLVEHGYFTCDDLDTTGATSITVDFWYRLHDTELMT